MTTPNNDREPLEQTYYQKNQDRIKAENRKRYHLTGKSRRMVREYGISLTEANNIWRYQGGRCACCGKDIEKPGNGRDVHLDHDHATGRVRGILCVNCNLMLGHAKDDPEILKKAIRYLEINKDL
jgi:hypothetical protein